MVYRAVLLFLLAVSSTLGEITTFNGPLPASSGQIQYSTVSAQTVLFDAFVTDSILFISFLF